MHECPECMSGCHCGGDIDDMLLDDEAGCTHCPLGGDVDDPDDGRCPCEDCFAAEEKRS